MLLLYLAHISFINCLRASRISEKEEVKDLEDEGEETLWLMWLIGGLVFSSLRCLLETWREPMSCSRDPGATGCLFFSKCGNCIGGIGLARMSSAARWSKSVSDLPLSLSWVERVYKRVATQIPLDRSRCMFRPKYDDVDISAYNYIKDVNLISRVKPISPACCHLYSNCPLDGAVSLHHKQKSNFVTFKCQKLPSTTHDLSINWAVISNKCLINT